jgi:iron(III) transport system substrate-binding protein
MKKYMRTIGCRWAVLAAQLSVHMHRHWKAGMAALLFAAPFMGSTPAARAADDKIVVYCGRSKSLVAPILSQFESQTGIKVDVKYGKTPELAITLREEGARSPADVFWSQDAGALGAVQKANLLSDLPADLVASVPPMFRHSGGKWVAVSGRARVLAYSSKRVKKEGLPTSVFELTDPRFKGKIGWAPSNASFQSFVTAMRKMHGDEKTKQWLLGVKANMPHSFASNAPIIQAIASGEIDYGLPNHYYLLGFKKAEGVDVPVDQTFFAAGDVGNLVNVAGVGILASAKHKEAAEKFVRFLLSPVTQQYFSSDTLEYPVITKDIIANPSLVSPDQLMKLAPAVTLDDLDDLEGTLALLRTVGLL